MSVIDSHYHIFPYIIKIKLCTNDHIVTHNTNVSLQISVLILNSAKPYNKIK